MGWLKRMFGLEKPEDTDEEAVVAAQEAGAEAQEAAGVDEIPPDDLGHLAEDVVFVELCRSQHGKDCSGCGGASLEDDEGLSFFSSETP